MKGGLIVLFVVVVYGALIAAVVRWARGRMHRRVKTAADALRGAGAEIHRTSPATGLYGTSDVDFTLDGRPGTFQARRWSRDYVLLSISLPSPPQPSILVRKEQGRDRLGKSLGLNREVQLGDPTFDPRAYIESSAADDVVLRTLAHPEVRRGVLEVLDQGFKVDLSAMGLSATKLVYALSQFDAAPLPAVMRGLQVIAAHLPPADPSTITPRAPRRLSLAVGISIGIAFIGYLLSAGLLAALPAPIEGSHVMHAVIGGLAIWVGVVIVLTQILRGRPTSFRELLVSSTALLLAVPSLAVAALFFANSAFDTAPGETESARVVTLPRKGNSVGVTPWDPTRTTQTLKVPWPVLRKLRTGDLLKVEIAPGALGWPWVRSVTKVD